MHTHLFIAVKREPNVMFDGKAHWAWRPSFCKLNAIAAALSSSYTIAAGYLKSFQPS
jgi:hypothetical protein